MYPNKRASLLNLRTLGTDPLVDKILQEPESAEAISYGKAKLLHTSPLKKSYVEASLLASDDLDQISAILEIPTKILSSYRSIFYDVEGLDKLSRMDLLNGPDKNENNMKLWAVSQGLPFIAFRLGKQVNVSPVEGLQDLYTMCVFKSKEALFNGNISEASKESTKFIKLSMDIARLIKVWVLDSAAAKRDIELALEDVSPEFEGFSDLNRDDSDNETELPEIASIDSLGPIEGLEDFDLGI